MTLVPRNTSWTKQTSRFRGSFEWSFIKRGVRLHTKTIAEILCGAATTNSGPHSARVRHLIHATGTGLLRYSAHGKRKKIKKFKE